MNRLYTRPPLLIAVEGPCASGKTTLVNTLSRHLPAACVLAEYATLAPLPPFPPSTTTDIARSLRHFLALEQTRQQAAATTGAELWLADRSPLTLIAFEDAVTALGVPGDPRLAAHLFTSAAAHGLIRAPDAYVHLTVPPHTARRRLMVRGPVRGDLTDPRFTTRQAAFFSAYLDLVPDQRRLSLDGRQPEAELTTHAAAFIATLTTTRAPHPPAWTTQQHPNGTVPES